MIGATFANSAAVSMLDFDDGHRAAAGHPGAAIVPAVLAAVHANPEFEPRALTAIAIGYEIGLRIAAARDLKNLDTVNTGRWCGQGAAAAIGWLQGAPEPVIAESISGAGAVAPLMAYADFTSVGNNVKEAIPLATANGIASLHLAEAGFRAPLDILDDPRFFDGSALLNGLGKSWMIETSYFKPYGCCRWLHAPIDALVTIMAEHEIAFSDIKQIHVETFGRVLSLPNQTAPASLEAAQFSLPFCLGAVAVHGPQALVPLADDALLSDPDVLGVSSTVESSVDPHLDVLFSAEVPARVTVQCEAKSVSRTVRAPLGEPSNPISWEGLFKKFEDLSVDSLDPGTSGRINHALHTMRDGDLRPLMQELV